MNQAFRVIWNEARHLWLCASELVRTRDKKHSNVTRPVTHSAMTARPLTHSAKGAYRPSLKPLAGWVMVLLCTSAFASNPYRNDTQRFEFSLLDFATSQSSDFFADALLIIPYETALINPHGNGTWDFHNITLQTDLSRATEALPLWWNPLLTKLEQTPADMMISPSETTFDAAANPAFWQQFSGLRITDNHSASFHGDSTKPIYLEANSVLHLTDASSVHLSGGDLEDPALVLVQTNSPVAIDLLRDTTNLVLDLPQASNVTLSRVAPSSHSATIRTDATSWDTFRYRDQLRSLNLNLWTTNAFNATAADLAASGIIQWTIGGASTLSGSEYRWSVDIQEGGSLTINAEDNLTLADFVVNGQLNLQTSAQMTTLTLGKTGVVTVADSQTLNVSNDLALTDSSRLELGTGAQLAFNYGGRVVYSGTSPLSATSWWSIVHQAGQGYPLEISDSTLTLSQDEISPFSSVNIGSDSEVKLAPEHLSRVNVSGRGAHLLIDHDTTIDSLEINPGGLITVAPNTTLSGSLYVYGGGDLDQTLEVDASSILQLALSIPVAGTVFDIITNAIDNAGLSNVDNLVSGIDPRRIILNTTGEITTNSSDANAFLNYSRWDVLGIWHLDADGDTLDSHGRLTNINSGGTLSVDTSATLYRNVSINEGGVLRIAPNSHLTLHDNQLILQAGSIVEIEPNASIGLINEAMIISNPGFILKTDTSDLTGLAPLTNYFADAYIETGDDFQSNDSLLQFLGWNVAGKNTQLVSNTLDINTVVKDGGGLRVIGTTLTLNKDLTILAGGLLELDKTLTLSNTEYLNLLDGMTIRSNVTSLGGENTPSWWSTVAPRLAQSTLETTSIITSGSASGIQSWKVNGTGGVNEVDDIADSTTTIGAGVTLKDNAAQLKSTQTVINQGDFQFDAMTLYGLVKGSGTLTKVGNGTAVLAKTPGEDGEGTGDLIVAGGTLQRPKGLTLNSNVVVRANATFADTLNDIPTNPTATPSESTSPVLFAARRAVMRRTLLASSPAPTHRSTGGLTLDADSHFAVTIRSQTDYTRSYFERDVSIANGAYLDISLDGFGETSEESYPFDGIIQTGGTITGNFAADHILPQGEDVLFTFATALSADQKSLNLTLTPKTHSDTDDTDNNNHESTSPDSAEGIADNSGHTALSDMGAALDSIFEADVGQSPSAITRKFAGFRSTTAVANALEESAPLLSGTTNRALLDAMRAMQKATPWDRCGDILKSGKQGWASLIGGWTAQGGSAGAAGFDAHHEGIAVGTDVCHNTWKVGLMGAYTHSTVESDHTVADQTAKSDAWLLGVYGNKLITDRVDVDFGLSAGRARVKGTRDLTFAHETAKSTAHATLITAGAGLNWHLGTPTLAWTPFVRADYQTVRMGGYTESGSVLSLNVDKQTSESLILRAGVKVATHFSDRWEAFGKVLAGVDVLDNGYGITARFANAPAAAQRDFTVENTRHGRAVGEVELGGTYHVTPAVDLSAGVGTLLRKGQHDTAANLKVTVKF